MPRLPADARARAAGAYAAPTRGALKRPCPECQAPIGHKCRHYAYDDNGIPYVVRTRANVHEQRKHQPDPTLKGPNPR